MVSFIIVLLLLHIRSSRLRRFWHQTCAAVQPGGDPGAQPGEIMSSSPKNWCEMGRCRRLLKMMAHHRTISSFYLTMVKPVRFKVRMVLRKNYFNRIKTVEAGVHTQRKELLKGDETLIGYKTGKLLTKIRNQFFHRLYGNASMSKHLNVKKKDKTPEPSGRAKLSPRSRH